jgi:hypothetical protein
MSLLLHMTSPFLFLKMVWDHHLNWLEDGSEDSEAHRLS